MKKKEQTIQEIWSDAKRQKIKEVILEHSNNQSPERILRNKLLSIQYKIEDYLQNNSSIEDLKIIDFVKMYLKALGITKKALSQYFEMEDSNLHKYLIGERKLNPDLAMKLSAFTHTNPEHWYEIQLKNELRKFRGETLNKEQYARYDCMNLLK